MIKREGLSEGVGGICEKYIQEAEDYTPKAAKGQPRQRFLGKGVLAALFALCMIAGGIGIFSSLGGVTVTAYAHGTDAEITSAGVKMNTGMIRDTGEMTGQPLMFYLSGKEIKTVRFSCKNQQINFMDWTEKRDEFGLAQNFTVPYGTDESEYYYLLINWVPNATIRALTDHSDATIQSLPKEMREDTIVMEIVFEDGKTATKAIAISLLDDGSFLAVFDDYKISEEDEFVARPDSKAIPRDVLYAQGDSAAWSEEYPFGDAPVIEGDYQDADTQEPESVVQAGTLTFTGTIIESAAEGEKTAILIKADSGSKLPYDTVYFSLSESDAEWAGKIGAAVRVTCEDIFAESLPPIGTLISISGRDDS
ncbi:hypothetical protein [Hominifimenecus sp. rT4P-3]|uniref:hypothetical protein n=1 Tax=Hominifimenecus sp. rT4P-3 TaxID=3242979 RepID=UPI003DA296A6